MTIDLTIIGYLAGTCIAVAQFPQAYKVLKTGETQSISLVMYSIMTLGVVLWFFYGLIIKDLPMTLANGVCFVPSVYVLAVALKNLGKNKTQNENKTINK
jgi:MtN3 and saliva related transmembrane protein